MSASIILSYSQIQDFAHCHRKWWWSRRIGLREPSLAALKGQCVHEIVQYCHTAEQPETEGINFIVDKYKDILSPSQTSNLSLEVLKPLGRAYLEINSDKLFRAQAEVHWETESLHGYIDLVQYSDDEGPRIGYEIKSTSDMEYVSPHGLGLQLGVYFLGNPALKRIVVRVIKFPDLQRRKNESDDEYLERTYQQIKKFPGAYFKDLHVWREELNLDEIREEVRRIQRDITSFEQEGQLGFYKDRLSCSVPFPCPYLPLCELGVKDWKDSPVTEGLYKERSKERGIKSSDNDKWKQGNGEDFFCL